MNQICKITVQSNRSMTSFGVTPPILEEEEDWNEDFAEEDDLFFPEGDVPTDGWKKRPTLPTVPPPTTTLLTSYGVLSREADGSLRVSYEDSEITGLEGCLTTFCLSPSGMLIMLRRGPVETCMVFEKDHRHLCDYGKDLGFPSVCIQTHDLESALTEKGGMIRVRYSVDAGGTLTERNELVITVEPN